MITQLILPVTPDGRKLVSEREKREQAVRYQKQKRAAKRIWDPVQLAKEGVTSDTFRYGEKVDIAVDGLAEVECLEGRYTAEGYLASAAGSAGRDMYQIWGEEEGNHFAALLMYLVDSGRMTPAQAGALIDYTFSGSWSFNKQIKLPATVLNANVYAVNQENETKWTYHDLLEIVWKLQGSPCDAKGQRVYKGLAKILYLLWRDEAAHEANFTANVLIDLKYFPSNTLEAIWKVFRKYRMPKVLIRDYERFITTLVELGITSKEISDEVKEDSRKNLGFDDELAVRKALKTWSEIPIDSVIQLPKSKYGVDAEPDVEEGSVNIYRADSDGTFTLVSAKAA